MAKRGKKSFNVFFLSLLIQLPLSGSFTSEDVIVKDRLFTVGEIRGLRTLLSHEETMWTFQQRKDSDIERPEAKMQAPEDSCYRWSTKLTPASFMESSAWRKLSKTLSLDLSVKGDSRILSVEGQINIKASHMCSRQFSSNDSNINSVVAVIFLVENWRRNSYGELVVYDKGEILKAVHPKQGRLVIFPANLEHVIKPPAIDLSGRLYVMTAHILLSDEKKQTNTVSTKEDDAVKKYPSFRLLTKADTSPRERVDIKQFITRNFTTIDGRYIVVFDDILPAKELDALMETVLNSGYNDNAAGEDSADNVQWIMGFEVDDFIQTSMWQLVTQIVATVSGKKGYYPYDIGLNNIQSADSTTIHRDCQLDENEFTLLIYLNQNWTENHHGETVFFSDMEGSEIIFALRPKYGRVAIFHGTIPHSARPPPFTFTGARLSFAVKMSPSKEIAERKAMSIEAEVFYQALESLQGAEAEKVKNILQDIHDGKMDHNKYEQLVKEYEAKLS